MKFSKQCSHQLWNSEFYSELGVFHSEFSLKFGVFCSGNVFYSEIQIFTPKIMCFQDCRCIMNFFIQSCIDIHWWQDIKNLERISAPANHIGSWEKIQDISHISYQYNLWCQRLLHPSSLKSGTINILQVPNLSFICQIMSYLDLTFRIGPLATTHIVFNFQLYTILQISFQEWSTSSKPQSHSLADLSLYFSSDIIKTYKTLY